MRIERVDDEDLIEIDEKQLITAIGRVVTEEIGAQTQAALNQALGRLD